MTEDWLARWEQGRTGWHEAGGSSSLRKYWPDLPQGSKVLVPLCGKTPDLAWLESRGLEVTGVELSPLAAEAFFSDRGLRYSDFHDDDFRVYMAVDRNIRIYCGDYFSFRGQSFDAIYDRGALVALPPGDRRSYARHTDCLLRPGATRLLITLEYDQAIVDGPPFAVMADEVREYWPLLERISEKDDLRNSPPKFLERGLREITEVIWTTAGTVRAQGPPTARR
ncbi:MAG: thiopurine S-methyltransferase [Woeseiaceae bacterium]|nr:thiopurine S-methyltransferase [Woeseiaceae bacterium]